MVASSRALLGQISIDDGGNNDDTVDIRQGEDKAGQLLQRQCYQSH